LTISEKPRDDSLAGTTPVVYRSRIRLVTWAAAAVAAVALGAGAVLWLAAPATHRSSPAAERPPFLVGLDHASTGLTVVNAVSGRLITALAPPKGFFDRATAATADGRAFIVAAEMSQGGCSTWLYRLRLTAQGHEAALAPLKVPKVSGLIMPTNGLSASADGNTVAYTASPCSQGQDGLVGVISLRTGRVRTWRLNATSAWSVSLSPDGRRLAFVDTVVYGGDGTVRTMPADAPPGPVTRVAHPVLPAGLGVDVNGSIALSANGTVMLACSENSHDAVLAAYNVPTGHRLGTIYVQRNVDVAPCDIGATSSGRYVLLYDIGFGGIGRQIDLATRKVTELAGNPGHQPPLGLSW
jgi:hypothetical protein